MERGWSQEGRCARRGGQSGTGQDQAGALGSRRLLLRRCPSPLPPPVPPPVRAPSGGHHGKVREAPGQPGLRDGSGTFESTARGGVGRQKASRHCAPWGRRGDPFPQTHGSVRCGTGEQAAWVCKLPGAPGGRCFWSAERLFGSSGRSGGSAGTGGGTAEGGTSVGCRGQPQISRGQGQARPKVPGGQCQVESHGWRPWHCRPRKPQVRSAPCDPWAAPTTPAPRAARSLGGGWEPPLPQQICKQRQKGCPLRNPETWASRCGRGSGGSISGG